VKKGITPTISWILLVGLTITLAGIVTVWVKDIAQSSATKVVKDVESDIRCTDISVNAYEKVAPLCLQVTVQNRGLFSIQGVKIRYPGSVEDVMFVTPLLPGSEATITLNISNPLPDKKIGLIPITKVDKDMLACMAKEVDIVCS